MMEELFRDAAKELKTPAGEGEKFSSAEAISRNRPEFVERCHATWKKWHDKATTQILFFDGFLIREKTHPLGDSAKSFGEYHRIAWRRVNDAIVWSLAGCQRHIVKRLCLYRQRTFLSESNPDSIFAKLAELNANPMSFALWNDTTTCVDVGDITYIKDGMHPVPSFLELKEGAVNAAVVEVMQAEPTSYEQALTAFKQRYGERGEAQLKRATRQQETSNQALKLLREEKGIDPVSGHEFAVTESPLPPETYDGVLSQMLNTALDDGKCVTEVIDGCLWICVNGDPKVRPAAAYAQFGDELSRRVKDFPGLDRLPRGANDKDKVITLQQGLPVHMSKPIFLRSISPEAIGSLIAGRLRGNVFLYLDWEGFEKLFNDAGGKFRWASRRERGRVQSMNRFLRPPLIRGRLPKIELEGDGMAFVTDPNLIEIFFDGITPGNMARRTVLELKEMAEKREVPTD